MAETTPNISSTPSYPLRTRFALRFLKTLRRIKKHSSQRIKLASYSSMAQTVGSSRAWSRALLLRLRARRRLRCPSRINHKKKIAKTKKRSRVHVVVGKKTLLSENYKKQLGLSRADELRRLVPGGETMDLCSLFEETGHFVQCLATQVKVMQSIADHYSC